MPGDLKEVHFFDKHWDRGLDWYNGLYDGARPGQVRWESTPHYLYAATALERMQGTLTNARFVVLLRDPPARTLSHYRRYLANTDRTASFAEACDARRNLTRYSRYSDFLPAYFAAFGRKAFLVRFFEDIAKRPTELLREVTDFIGIDPLETSEQELRARINEAPAPRYPTLHARLEKTKRRLNRSGFGRIVDIARASGMRQVLTGNKTNNAVPPLTIRDVEMLTALRGEEVKALAALDIDASHWTERALPKADAA